VSVIDTVLVFVGIPLGVVLLLVAAVYGPSAARQPRYRPGRPWAHEPVWFLPAPDGVAGHSASPSHQPPAIEAPAGAIDAPVRTAVGGATGEW
jgi:hypothetical protein